LSTDGLGYCWGEPWTYDGTVVAVPVLDGAHALESGGNHVCAVKNGQPLCIGQNNHRQLGLEDIFAESGTPIVPGEVVQVGAGYWLSCALTTTGEVYCWGSNYAGALGIGSTSENDFPEPQLVTFPP
jgi:alpha-tubulin suppressor-like RCC1 family protein